MWRQRRSPDTPVLDVRRIRRSFDFASHGPGRDQQRGEHPAAARAARALPGSSRPATRTSTAGSRPRPGDDGAVRGVVRHDRGLAQRARAGAASPLYRNTTEAINAVMYSLLTEFRDGDNVVTTMLEHNSNYVPWYALCREILPRLGRRVECRLARFDHATGRARPRSPGVAGRRADQAGLLHRRVELPRHQAAAATGPRDRRRERLPAALAASGGRCCWWTPPSWCPSTVVDVQALDVDYLAFSFHKLLAPFGVGVLYAKEHLLEASLPFLYGGDMIAEGQVSPGPRRVQRPAVEVRRRHAEHPRRRSSPRRRCGWCSTWSSGRPAGLVPHRAARRTRRPSTTAHAAGRRAHPRAHRHGRSPGCARSTG